MRSVQPDELKELMSRFDSVRVLVVGDVMMDEYVWGRVDRISPEAPVPVVHVQRESWVPGGAGNVVTNLCALGVSTDLLGLLGDDEPGRALREELAGRGVGVDGLLSDSSRTTIRKTRVVAQHQQVVRVDREKREPIDEALTSRLLDAAYRALPETDVVVIEDYGKGIVTEKVCAGLIAKARELGKPVLVDPQIRRFHMYRATNLVTPNLREAADAVGVEPHNDDECAEMIARRLKEMIDCDMVLVTRGEGGMSLLKADGEFCTMPAAAREVFDVSGAGDTVVATVAAGIGAGGRPEAACALANYAAGGVVAKLGTATVTRDEIVNAIETGSV